MRASDDLRAEKQEAIARIVEQFAGDFHAGRHPRIEDYVDGRPELHHELLQSLISLEWKLRLASGEDVSPEEFRRRFPEQSMLSTAAMPSQKVSDDRRHLPKLPETPPLTRLGRYEIRRVLGRGGFGIVYLALDPQLDREVAVKVPRRDRFADKAELERFLGEARTAARLKHAMLVAVYDVQEQHGMPFIVQEYVESRNLSQWRAEERPSFEQMARVMIGVAEAVGYLHEEGLIHCDLKSANVLIDKLGRPHVADFGLTTHESAQPSLKGQWFGTPSTMAPEQIRGESHLLDGRTDIWAIGVMLYHLLTGRMPFAAADRDELFEVIRSHDPRPPRQIERGVPKELERICLKCLSRRRADRYNTADDFRDDMAAWLSDDCSEGSSRPETVDVTKAMLSSRSGAAVNIIPKGLRAYDAEDADFFLSLLPGPRDREGLPESVRFWRNRIEQRDPDKTFRVGLLYGPSGCGKSSLVRAALIPRLSDQVLAIYVEADPDDTEARILRELRKHLPDLPVDATLPEACALLRKAGSNGSRKVLLVIDQFEQWLHAHPQPGNTPFVDALRQCEGGALQSLLMVRDDFYLSVNRVFQELEVRLLEGSNCGVVDHFDIDHSRKVLASLGRAYGRLGDSLSSGEEQFLAQAVDELAEDRKVICVRLALFADMMKSRPWVPLSLQHVGGFRGVGVAMLEESFHPQRAPLAHRAHEDAIRRVLKALLPSAGTGIKGAMQSAERLREIAGYADRPRLFNELIEILDSEMRLITPTDVAGVHETEPRSPYYQLTHDYLVPSLRMWLMRKQNERLQGRAELRLAELAADWAARPQNRRLPATWEYVSIRTLTRSAGWSPRERHLMRAAGRFHGRRWGLLLGAFLIIGALGGRYVSMQQDRLDMTRTDALRKQAGLLVDAALTAPADAVPYAARNLEPVREFALPVLRQRFDDEQTSSADRIRTAVLLAGIGEPRSDYLIEHLDRADSAESSNVIAALDSTGAETRVRVEELIQQARANTDWRRTARLALTALHLGQSQPARDMLSLRPDPIQRVTLIDAIPGWHGPIERLLQAVNDPEPASFRSGLCLGVGAIPPDSLTPTERTAVLRLLSRWSTEAREAEVHSAAGWALRRWGEPMPETANDSPANRDWSRNRAGITMVRIRHDDRRAGVERAGTSGAPRAAYWLSDCEISRRTFQLFVDDPDPGVAKPLDWQGADLARSPSQDHPVQRVSWNDGVMFCNWLSGLEQRSPCYARNGETWKRIDDADGYRLPTEAEWEMACRAGTTTAFVCGDDETLLSQYAVYRFNQTAPCGSKLPNPWGLFDMHGNVYEWCEDWLLPGEERVLRSGAFDYDATKSRSSNRQSNVSDYRSFTIGLRIARDDD